MTIKNRRYYQVFFAVALGGLAFTQVGNLLSAQPVSGLLPAANAQEFTDTDVANYANAVLEIEASRVEAYSAASDILLAATEGEVDILETQLSCQAHKMADMPDIPKSDKVELQETLVAFCKSARLIAETNELTAKRFNSLTAAHQEDTEEGADLTEQIQAVISDLQAPAEAPASDEPAAEEG